jgi:hypothetical protein
VDLMSDKEIVASDIARKALEHFNKYLEIKDKILDNEYVQLFGEVSKVVSFVRGTNQLIINKKFQRFLEGFNEDEKPIDEQIEKLMKYVDDETKAEFISDTFTKVMLANSSKACLIMGSILHSIVSTEGPLEHEKLICINALTNLFDMDLENLKILDEYINSNNKRSIYLPSLLKYCKERGINYKSLELTVEKCVSSQLMYKYYLADINADIDIDSETVDFHQSDIDEYHKITAPGNLLVKYMNRVLKY